MRLVSSVEPLSTRTSSIGPAKFCLSEASACIVNANLSCRTMMTETSGVSGTVKSSAWRAKIASALRASCSNSALVAGSARSGTRSGGQKASPSGTPIRRRWAKASRSRPALRSSATRGFMSR